MHNRVQRPLVLAGYAIALAAVAGVLAQALTRLIFLVTHLAFFGRFSVAPVSPSDHHLGIFVVAIPMLGGLIIGLMARYGSKAIRGHGIPEAMEQVLTNQSRIPPRITFLKPLSAAISIGTGGPFGAEGPIIATGSALGSWLGQVRPMSAIERKTLLAAGAAAGMAATFGSPISAILLAVELLLFEYRARSLVPVALAATVATAIHSAFQGSEAVFPMPELAPPSSASLVFYVAMGAVLGLASIAVTKAIYFVEDAFENLPISWVWWPALGGIAVGLVGYVAPRTLGVGYTNIEDLVAGRLALPAILVLCSFKFVSWAISLGSGTSGGTLAPLLTLGGGLGAILGSLAIAAAPGLGVDVRIAALVGMAALFAGASRALLASMVFAFEATRQPHGILPLLGGCTASFMVSSMFMKNSIMTEKIVRRGVRVLSDYSADHLDQIPLKTWLVGRTRPVVTLDGDALLVDVAGAFDGHNHSGFPVVDGAGELIGVLTRRELTPPTNAETVRVRDRITRPAIVIYDDCSLRDAADCMAWERIGRLPIVARTNPLQVVGILTRSDLLEAHIERLEDHRRPAAEPAIVPETATALPAA